MSKFGFVYIWYDCKHKRYYIGSHWGTINDGYICSSNWMRDAYKRRPQDFKRRILSKIYSNKIDTFHKEQEWLNLIKPTELKIRYYNLHTSVHHWIMYPESVKTIGQKISLANKGQVPWNLGQPTSDKAKEKQRQAKLLNPTQHWKGKTFSTEHKQNLSNARKGRAPWNKGINLINPQV